MCIGKGPVLAHPSGVLCLTVNKRIVEGRSGTSHPGGVRTLTMMASYTHCTPAVCHQPLRESVSLNKSPRSGRRRSAPIWADCPPPAFAG